MDPGELDVGVRDKVRLSVESSPTADESEADESPHIVLRSSTELFYFYRQSLELKKLGSCH